MMLCPECKSEMSKKWQPKSAHDAAAASGLVWLCGVCGCQLTMADMKSHVPAEPKAEHEVISELLTSTRPDPALSSWVPRDEKRIRG